MTTAQADKAIVQLFSKPLAAHGFSLVTDGIFARVIDEDISQRLAFAGRIAPDHTFLFTIYVGIRFCSLESLLHPDTDSPTVVMPIHLVRPDQRFTEWCLSYTVRDEVLSDVARYAFPFLTANSSLTAVRERLRSESPRDWYILDPVSRLRTLIAIEFVQGDRKAAVERLDAVIAERQTALPKHRLPFVALRRRFDEVLSA